MGIEYRHFLVVNEADWRPQADTVARIETVLRRWNLIDTLEKVVDLSPGANNRLKDAASASSPGPGIAFVYSGVQGPTVEHIAGLSAYKNVSPADRYTMNTTLVVGEDFRVQWSSESIYFELVSPPIANGAVVTSDENEEPFDILFSESFPSHGVTVPPIVAIHVEDHAKPNVSWETCLGYWRGALVIDFGKDLPLFSESVHMLPAREFVAAISEAFRGPIVEIGEFY